MLFRLNLYIPISKLDENLHRSLKRDAVRSQKLFFPVELKHIDDPENSEIAEFSCAEIFSKLLPFLVDDLRATKKSEEESCAAHSDLDLQSPFSLNNAGSDNLSFVAECLEFVRLRSTGEEETPATFMRRFLAMHPSYARDSEVTEEAVRDLVLEIRGWG